jgi:hypothetical protein
MPAVSRGLTNKETLKIILSVLAMAYLFLITVLLFYKGLPTGEAGGAALTLIGIAGLLAKDPYSFVFGSSQGSQDKSATLTSQLPKS